MAEPQDRMPADRLLIKVILPRQGTERKVEPGGTPPKPFRTVTHLFRQSLSVRLNAVRENVRSVGKLGVAPVRVRLIKEASAKSHRPESIFSSQTCPIIGAGKLGELFIKGTDAGLAKINKLVLEGNAANVKKEISTIETIEPVTPEFRRNGISPEDILRRSPKDGERFVLKVQLFEFGNEDQIRIYKDFVERCRAANIPIDQGGYSESSAYLRATCKDAAQVESLSKIVGVRSIKRMPILRAIRTKSQHSAPLPTDLPLPTDRPEGYPVVVVVDSGIDDGIASLKPWIVGRRSQVPDVYKNTKHGTFVAGLVCWGKQLNPTINAISDEPCKVFDLHVMPNDDPDHGDTDNLEESQFLQDLETALQQHANDFKVWNLSMGTDEVCSLDDFSSFAVELDRLQEEYNVSFVISAGNYATRPLLDYPRQGRELAEGRITTPADSVLGITVGSVAHVSHTANGPQAGQPSGFSRHGPGPNYIIKPDLVHFGGTLARDASDKHGIKSVEGQHVAEDFGTSFSAPLVSRTLANIYHQITPSPDPVLARALLTHHARHPATGQRVPDMEENFVGFGLPGPVASSLECAPWSSTLVFEDTLRPGYFLEWDNFPYPDSLRRNGRYFGEIWMTAAFAPIRGNRWGTEYCETHIEASCGVFYKKKLRKTGLEKMEFKGLVPPEHKNPGALYEMYQVQKLRKWAPVRTYFGSLGPAGQRGERWRLKVRLLHRHGIQDRLVSNPQRFALILTIADPKRTAPVYDEMAIKVRGRFQFQNLSLRSTVRVQGQL
ncbi:MAG: S8 family peptidase [Elusimicrobia bacterium]|nr:S8 family peptidase [Elusimicrobiota bacterium]